jgi:hypothetical protein
VLQLYANLRLQAMEPVKLLVGYKYRLIGSSRNSLGLRDIAMTMAMAAVPNLFHPGRLQ